MALNNVEMTQSLFEAIDAIIAQRLQKLPFDRMVTAHITSVNAKAHHKYQVTTDDNIIFDAYSIDNYEIGDYVYVRIPEGDYTKQKVITGLFVPIYNEE